MNTMGDIFGSYLENADEETLLGLFEVISDYMSATAAVFSTGVNVQV
jgi:hypothetical protein